MTTFQTPGPITAFVEIGSGDINVTASDRVDSLVTIRARDAAKEVDIQAAANATVDIIGGVLTVKTVKAWKRLTGPSQKDGSVIVDLELPSTSSLSAHTGMGLVHCEGELSATDVKTGLGDVRLDHVGALTARSGLGNVVVATADDVTVSTGSGFVRLGSVLGTATVKNSSGNVDIAQCDRDINVRTASGDITIGRALGSVVTRSASGQTTIAEVSSGSVNARTSVGAIHIGVRDGAAAWLDVASKYGTVRNGLDAAAGPGESDSTVEVRARTGAGDITIERANSAQTSRDLRR